MYENNYFLRMIFINDIFVTIFQFNSRQGKERVFKEVIWDFLQIHYSIISFLRQIFLKSIYLGMCITSVKLIF